MAKIKLDEAIEKNNGKGEGLYIVTDIDATLMDDSAYIAGVILSKADRHKQGLEPCCERILRWRATSEGAATMVFGK